jgi:DNA-binding MarR family transcriptional regulator
MDRPFSHTLSFDDLEVLVLVENGCATPREVADSLGMDTRQSKASFRDLVRRGLIDWQGRPHAPAALPLPWSFASTVFQLTPLARSLRRDEAINTSAFAASLLA